jgi:hypothetical protein
MLSPIKLLKLAEDLAERVVVYLKAHGHVP